MERTPEPELMEGEAQARAYAEADFAEPHDRFVLLLRQRLPQLATTGAALDLGCGPGDVTARVARSLAGWTFDGVDGSEAMLRLGRERIAREGLSGRVCLLQGYLPDAAVPRQEYDLVFSNALLHHLRRPADLWRCVRRWLRPGGSAFVMDLTRPDSREQAECLVERYAAGEPEILRRDFLLSLCAAYRAEEIRRQLDQCAMAGFTVEPIGDRHWIAWGLVDRRP